MAIGYKMPAKLRRKAGQTLDLIGQPYKFINIQRGRTFRFSARSNNNHNNGYNNKNNSNGKLPLRC